MGVDDFNKDLVDLLIAVAEKFVNKRDFHMGGETYFLLAQELSESLHDSFSRNWALKSCRRAKMLYGYAKREKDPLGREWLDDALNGSYQREIEKIDRYLEKHNL